MTLMLVSGAWGNMIHEKSEAKNLVTLSLSAIFRRAFYMYVKIILNTSNQNFAVKGNFMHTDFLEESRIPK